MEEDKGNFNDFPEITPVSVIAKDLAKPLYIQLAMPVAIVLAAILISGSIFYYTWYNKTNNQQAAILPAASSQPIDIKLSSADHVIGDKNAKVAIFEFSDFQCPFCRRFFEDSYSQLKKKYIDTGRAYLVFKHFPLGFHPAAISSAKAVECAGDNNKFWELHDKIFQEQAKLGQGTVQFVLADIKKWAAQIGLGGDFIKCVDSEKYTTQINDSVKLGLQLGVDGTPTFFINGVKVVGAQPFSEFQRVIEEALAKK